MPLMPSSPRRSSPPNNPGAGGRTNPGRLEPGDETRDSRLGLKQEPEPGGPNRPKDERRVRSLPYRPFREPDDAISEIPGPASVKERRLFCPANMGGCRNLRPKIQLHRMTAIFSRSFFVPVPGRSYFQPRHVIPPAQSTTANLCADFAAQTSALIFAPIPRTDSEASAGRRPFPVSGGCGEGRKSSSFSAPRRRCMSGVNRPHPARSPAGDYSATSLSVRLRELIVR